MHKPQRSSQQDALVGDVVGLLLGEVVGKVLGALVGGAGAAVGVVVRWSVNAKRSSMTPPAFIPS